MKHTRRFYLYRFLWRAVFNACVDAGFFLARSTPPLPQKKADVWFHAASVGELETLRPIIDLGSGNVAVSIFSDSAQRALTGIPGDYARGASPWEGRWGEWLDAIQPRVFVTARYEAWPELWAELAARGIPLVIVAAGWRPSLKWAKFILGVLGMPLPNVTFCVSSAETAEGLKKEFKASTVAVTGDPRWDRIAERAGKGSPRAETLVRASSSSPRPWGVLGSVWPEDLEIWGERLRTCPGTLWIVPHSLDPSVLQEIRASLSRLGVEWQNANDRHLIQEMGFLLELYASADWAYVGGGFNRGLHSVMEPALHGIPVAGGPKKAASFPEVGELEREGVFTLVSNAHELSRWLKDTVLGSHTSDLRSARRASIGLRLGAAQRVNGVLDRMAPHE